MGALGAPDGNKAILSSQFLVVPALTVVVLARLRWKTMIKLYTRRQKML